MRVSWTDSLVNFGDLTKIMQKKQELYKPLTHKPIFVARYISQCSMRKHSPLPCVVIFFFVHPAPQKKFALLFGA